MAEMQSTARISVNVQGVNYPGLVPRQDLVDVLQAELPKLAKENLELSENIDMFERMHGDHTHTIQAFNLGLAENIGFQKALRFVAEWAKEHIVETPPVGDAENEIAAMKDELRKKYNV